MSALAYVRLIFENYHVVEMLQFFFGLEKGIFTKCLYLAVL